MPTLIGDISSPGKYSKFLFQVWIPPDGKNNDCRLLQHHWVSLYSPSEIGISPSPRPAILSHFWCSPPATIECAWKPATSSACTLFASVFFVHISLWLSQTSFCQITQSAMLWTSKDPETSKLLTKWLWFSLHLMRALLALWIPNEAIRDDALNNTDWWSPVNLFPLIWSYRYSEVIRNTFYNIKGLYLALFASFMLFPTGEMDTSKPAFRSFWSRI